MKLVKATLDERVVADVPVRLIGDNRKIRSLTPWQPRFDMDAGLANTIEWFREPANLARYKAWIYNV